MNAILILTGAVGLFLIGMGLTDAGWRPKAPKKKLEAIDAGTLPPPAKTAPSVQRWLTGLLYQARAPISVPEFLGVSLGLGGLLAVGALWATGGLLLALAMVPLGSSLYYVYLTGRRAKLARAYEEAQPQVIYALYFYLKSHGLDVQHALEHVGESGPEIVRADWLTLAAAVQGADVNAGAINRLLTDRGSASFTRLVEALLLFRGEKSGQLPQILEDLRRDISLEVEIARESTTSIYGARRQLLMVALMPVALSIVFILMMPAFRAFYASLLGQILLLGMYLFSGAVYVFGAQAAAKASSVRPYTFVLPESRPASFYRQADPGQTGAQAAAWQPTWGSPPAAYPEGEPQS